MDCHLSEWTVLDVESSSVYGKLPCRECAWTGIACRQLGLICFPMRAIAEERALTAELAAEEELEGRTQHTCVAGDSGIRSQTLFAFADETISRGFKYRGRINSR